MWLDGIETRTHGRPGDSLESGSLPSLILIPLIPNRMDVYSKRHTKPIKQVGIWPGRSIGRFYGTDKITFNIKICKWRKSFCMRRCTRVGRAVCVRHDTRPNGRLSEQELSAKTSMRSLVIARQFLFPYQILISRANTMWTERAICR